MNTLLLALVFSWFLFFFEILLLWYASISSLWSTSICLMSSRKEEMVWALKQDWGLVLCLICPCARVCVCRSLPRSQLLVLFAQFLRSLSNLHWRDPLLWSDPLRFPPVRNTHARTRSVQSKLQADEAEQDEEDETWKGDWSCLEKRAFLNSYNTNGMAIISHITNHHQSCYQLFCNQLRVP